MAFRICRFFMLALCFTPLHYVSAQSLFQLGTTVTWVAPTTNIDGQPIDADLAEFSLCVRFAPLPTGSTPASFEADCPFNIQGLAPTATTWSGLIPSATSAGTLYGYVVAHDQAGQHSPYSVAGTAVFDIDAAPGSPGAVTTVITTTITTIAGTP